MPISQDTIREVHDAADIVAVVREYTELTRRGGNDWWGCCPFHNEKTASFHVDGDKGFYYCFGCHAGGDVLKFVMEMEKLSYSEAITMLAKKAGIEVKYTGGGAGEGERLAEKEKEAYIDLYERTSAMFHYLLTQTELGKRAYAYIKGRGITDQTIAKFRLGYAPADRKWLKRFLRGKNYSDEFLLSSGLFSKKYPDVSFFSDRLMFPIMDRRGKCVAFGGRLLNGDGPKYLNSGDMVRYAATDESGYSPTVVQYKKGDVLYALNVAKKAIREQKRVIFCEGYMDCIAYHQCGIVFAVAPLGTALTENQLKSVSSFVDTVLLSFDSDQAGIQATEKAILMCRKMNIPARVINLRGGKDPAEIMVKLGPDVLTKYVDDAILDSDFLLYTLGRKYAIDTPDGKTRVCRDFFGYVDVLSSTVLAREVLDKLSRFLSLNEEAVRTDYQRHKVAAGGKRRVPPIALSVSPSAAAVEGVHFGAGVSLVNDRPKSPVSAPIRKTRELRAVLSAVVNTDLVTMMTSALEADDFSDDVARGIFRVLKRCTGRAAGDILSGVAQDEGRGALPHGTYDIVLDALSSGEYTNADVKRLVMDSVITIKRGAQKKTVAALKDAISKSALLGDSESMSHFLEDKARLDSRDGGLLSEATVAQGAL